MLKFVLLVCLVPTVSAWFFSDSPEWDGLRVTFGLNPFDSDHFDRLPRTVEDATGDGWTLIESCDVTKPWRGERYALGGDYAVILLFDVNGYIAGIQTSIPNNQANGYPRNTLRPPFMVDGDRYTISAYFVDPSIICAGGRTASDFNTQGTGTGLYLQRTENPLDSERIPTDQTDLVQNHPEWTEGKCFWSMGKHYWYNLTPDMNCEDYYPVFLLYNDRKVNAFGWAMLTDLSSERYEHPTADVINLFIKNPPQCLIGQTEPMSTMHIYFTNSVRWSNRC